jgi:hypothetical protein
MSKGMTYIAFCLIALCVHPEPAAQVNVCGKALASRQHSQEILEESNYLYEMVLTGNNVVENTEKLRSLLCELKTTTYGPGSSPFVHVMLNYANALVRLGHPDGAAHVIAIELGPTSSIIADPQGIERLTNIVFEYGTQKDKRRVQGFYMTHADLELSWISFKLKQNLPVGPLDIDKLERFLTPYQRLVSLLPGRASGALLWHSSRANPYDSDSMKVWAFHAGDSFNLRLYKRVLGRVYGSFLRGYMARNAFILIFLFFALVGMTATVLYIIKVIKRFLRRMSMRHSSSKLPRGMES